VSGRHGGSVRPGERVVGFLDGWAPEAKLLGLLAFLLVVAVTPPERPWALAAQGGVAAAAAAAALVEPRALRRRLAIDIPLVVLAATYAVAGHGDRVTVLGLSLSSAGLRVGLALLAKATIGIVAVSAMAAATTVTEVVAGLRRLRVPGWLCDLVGLAARQVGVLGDDIERLRLAAAVRAGGGGRRRQAGAVTRALGVSFVRSVERVDRLQVAAEARGGAALGTLVRPALPLPMATTGTWVVVMLPALAALCARVAL
jgi:cobalt/nickel transport system permease protein